MKQVLKSSRRCARASSKNGLLSGGLGVRFDPFLRLGVFPPGVSSMISSWILWGRVQSLSMPVW